MFSVPMWALFLPALSQAECNHFYQANDASSTKRPFDMCYKSKVYPNASETSHRYYCIESTVADYGNDSVNGYTAFREDFKSAHCKGLASQTRIVRNPFQVNCSQAPNCDIVRYRHHDITNYTACTYNESVYEERIVVIEECITDSEISRAVFCNKHGNSGAASSYYWTNTYYGGDCNEDRLYNAIYTFHGCDGDGQTFTNILQCDVNSHGEASTVQPFEHNTFVAGFVLLLLAILVIVCILVWYCLWFKAGFHGIDKRNERVATVSRHSQGGLGHASDGAEDTVAMR